MALYNKRIWEVIKDKVAEFVAESISGGAIKTAIDAAIKAHEVKAASDTFANSHVPAATA
jgi:hypothetical protein